MERLRQTLAKFALVATTVTMAMTGFVGTAHAASITPTSDIMSNDLVSQSSVTHTVAFTTVSSAVSKCIQLTWVSATDTLTSSSTNMRSLNNRQLCFNSTG